VPAIWTSPVDSRLISAAPLPAALIFWRGIPAEAQDKSAQHAVVMDSIGHRLSDATIAISGVDRIKRLENPKSVRRWLASGGRARRQL
jgi:hypothetical protein